MMVLGSVAVITTSDTEEEDEAVADTSRDDVGHTPTTVYMDGGSEEVEESGNIATQALFARMGLINAHDPDDTDFEMPEAELNGPGEILEGSDEDDTLIGTVGIDLLGGAAGDDLIDGGFSDDELVGGDGNDTIEGGDGQDSLHGEDGRDALHGGAGADQLYGHQGDDWLYGGADDDAMHGGLGDDLLDGEDGDDALHGREGADTLRGGTGQDTLFGGWDNDLLSGVERDETGQDTDGRDYLNGGDGDDTIEIGAGDIVTGGDGEDVMILGDWAMGADIDEAAQLMDYDASEDQLVIVFDDSDETAEEPEVTLQPSPDNPDVTEILLDGTVISTLPTTDAPPLEAIVLMGQSAAESLALA